MTVEEPENTGLKQGQGNRPAPGRSSAGKTSYSPFQTMDSVRASDSHKMTDSQDPTYYAENRTQKHASRASILGPVFNQDSREEIGAGVPNGADAPQTKATVCTRGLEAPKPIDSRKVLSGVDGFETLETREPAVRARAADSRQSMLRGALSSIAVAFIQREDHVGGTLPYSWRRTRAGQGLV